MSEIFRHFRPLELTNRGELISQRNGGVSFLCRQNDDSSVDFWIYICPFNAVFSARAAVNKLRETCRVAEPWGHFIPTDDPLILQLVSMVSRRTELPTTVTGILLEIARTNLIAEEKYAELTKTSSLGIYAKD